MCLWCHIISILGLWIESYRLWSLDRYPYKSIYRIVIKLAIYTPFNQLKCIWERTNWETDYNRRKLENRSSTGELRTGLFFSPAQNSWHVLPDVRVCFHYQTHLEKENMEVNTSCFTWNKCRCGSTFKIQAGTCSRIMMKQDAGGILLVTTTYVGRNPRPTAW